MSKASPSSRTLALLRKQGHLAQTVEQWVPGMPIRKDLFNFIDIVALRDTEIIGIQATSIDNMSSRVHKIQAMPSLARWLRAGGKVEVWGWAKRKALTKKGKKRDAWTLKVIVIDRADPIAAPNADPITAEEVHAALEAVQSVPAVPVAPPAGRPARRIVVARRRPDPAAADPGAPTAPRDPHGHAGDPP